MDFIDCMLIPVDKNRLDAYKDFAEKVDAAFIEAGALEVVDCLAEDVPDGEVTSLPKAVALQDGEMVGFAWVRWPSKDVRDAAFEKVFSENPELNEFPFDGKRMIFGGFTPIVDLRKT